MMLILNYRQTVKDNSFLSTDVDVSYLGFYLRPKAIISDHWISHWVKERSGGHFEMEWKK